MTTHQEKAKSRSPAKCFWDARPLILPRDAGAVRAAAVDAVAEGGIEHYDVDAMLYSPPKSRDELLTRYAAGERSFVGSELDSINEGIDLTGVILDGADFSDSWIVASFRDASLKGAIFRRANVKTCDFSGANLTDADFRDAPLEATKWSGAILSGCKFGVVTYYGATVCEAEFLDFIQGE
jgi:hypothetical protein